MRLMARDLLQTQSLPGSQSSKPCTDAVTESQDIEGAQCQNQPDPSKAPVWPRKTEVTRDPRARESVRKGEFLQQEEAGGAAGVIPHESHVAKAIR